MEKIQKKPQQPYTKLQESQMGKSNKIVVMPTVLVKWKAETKNQLIEYKKTLYA